VPTSGVVVPPKEPSIVTVAWDCALTFTTLKLRADAKKEILIKLKQKCPYSFLKSPNLRVVCLN
jgi:hypothetical protein